MDSEDGEYFIKQLAVFVRTHEKALANALQFQRRESRHRSSLSTSVATIPPSPPLPERPSTSASNLSASSNTNTLSSLSSSSSLAATFSLGSLSLTSHNVKSTKLALTPHHLFYLLSRFEELGINVGPMKVRLENLHDASSSANYVSFLGNARRSRSRGSDVGSIHSVSSVRSVMSGMSAFWASFGIGASISAARSERQKAALQSDLKYLYSAFTKVPCLRLAPDWRARLIRGYEEFPFDSAVPIHVFKNLQALEVSSINVRQLFGWDRLADQLRSLTLRHAGIDDPADILIDIVLDDMHKRRRRMSKSQSSPITSWSVGSPRRSPTLPCPDMRRTASVCDSSDTRKPSHEARAGSVPDAAGQEDAAPSAMRPLTRTNTTDDFPRSPGKWARPRSNSPSRPSYSRSVSHIRSSQRVKRSGSGSSHSSLSDVGHHHAKASSASLLAMNTLPASKWRFLRHLCLADNALTSIGPSSLAPLTNTLYSLDLSANLFARVPECLSSLTALRSLNLSNCMIDSLHSLTSCPLQAVTALNLRGNRLQSIAAIENLPLLERLDLRDNHLADPTELARLTGIPGIREVWVEGNPFTRTHKHYRTTIFNLFRAASGCTVDVVIDSAGPSHSERRRLMERAPVPEPVTAPRPEPPAATTMAREPADPLAVNTSTRNVGTRHGDCSILGVPVSEVDNGSVSRRKLTKRRIVDLVSNNQAYPATPAFSQRGPPSKIDVAVSATATPPPPTVSSDDSCLSPKSVPPPAAARLSDKKGAAVHHEASPALDSPLAYISPTLIPTNSPPKSCREPPEWQLGGEVYRRKIEALHERVGSGYLSVLSEESWDGASGFGPPIPSPVSPFQAERMSHHVPPAQAIHSGRSIG